MDRRRRESLGVVEVVDRSIDQLRVTDHLGPPLARPLRGPLATLAVPIIATEVELGIRVALQRGLCERGRRTRLEGTGSRRRLEGTGLVVYSCG